MVYIIFCIYNSNDDEYDSNMKNYNDYDSEITIDLTIFIFKCG